MSAANLPENYEFVSTRQIVLPHVWPVFCTGAARSDSSGKGREPLTVIWYGDVNKKRQTFRFAGRSGIADSHNKGAAGKEHDVRYKNRGS